MPRLCSVVPAADLAHRRSFHRHATRSSGSDDECSVLRAHARGLRFHRQRVQKICDALRRLLGIEALGAATDPASRHRPDSGRCGRGSGRRLFDSDFVRIVGDAFDVLVPVRRHQYRVADGDDVCAEHHRLRDVAAVADAAGIDQRYLRSSCRLRRWRARLADRGDAGDPRCPRRQYRYRHRYRLHRIDGDQVGPHFTAMRTSS